MSTTVTIRPNADTIVPAAWGVTGAGSHNAALADANDATYSRNSTTFEPILLNLQEPSWPAGDVRITGVVIKVRGYRGASFNSLRAATMVATTGDPVQDDWQMASGSGAVAAYTGITRARQPNGERWTKDAVDYLGVLLWANFALDVYVTRLDVDVTYVDQPTVTVTAPTGTQTTSKPTVSWLYAQADGYPQDFWEVRIFDQATYEAAGFDPDVSTPVYATGERYGTETSHQVGTIRFATTGDGELSAFGTPTAAISDLDEGTYRAYVRVADTVQGEAHWSDWDYESFSVSYDSASVPVVYIHAQPEAGRMVLEIDGTDNLLTEQDASLEAIGTGTWTGFAANATLARVTSQFLEGTASLELTAASAADMAAYTTSLVRVKPGKQYSLQADFKANSTGRTVEVELQFIKADGTTTTGAAQIGSGTDTTGGWTHVYVAGATAPTDAAFVRPTLRVTAPANGEKHFVDAIKVAPSLSVWTRGGLVPRNLLTENQASLETDTTGWSARQNCTVTRQTTYASDGSASLRLASTAAGLMEAICTEYVNGLPVDTVAVVPGTAYTVLADLRGASVRACQIGIAWHDANGAPIGIDLAAAANDATGAWTQFTHTATAPTNAASGALIVAVAATGGAAEYHYVDRASFSTDATVLWQPGGSRITHRVTIQASDDTLDIDDVDATWFEIRPSAAGLELDTYQELTVYDYEAPPDRDRRYRSRVTAVDDDVALASAWSTTETGWLTSDRWWLKVPEQPDLNLPLDVVTDAPSTKTRRVGVHRPLDEQLAVVTMIGTGGRDGTLVVPNLDAEAIDTIEEILDGLYVVLLVSPTDHRYVVIIDDQPLVPNVAGVQEATFTYVETDRP